MKMNPNQSSICYHVFKRIKVNWVGLQNVFIAVTYPADKNMYRTIFIKHPIRGYLEWTHFDFLIMPFNEAQEVWLSIFSGLKLSPPTSFSRNSKFQLFNLQGLRISS